MQVSRLCYFLWLCLYVWKIDLNSARPSNLIAESIVDLTISLKNNSQIVSISNTITRNDNFNEKTMEVAYIKHSGYLKEFCIEKNIFSIDYTKTIQSRNINRSKLHLNKLGRVTLNNNFVKTIWSILHWYKIDGNNKGCLKVKECNPVPQNVSSNNKLNHMPIKHANKLIIVHLNISFLKNKFEFLVEFIRAKVAILMISETKIDESFPWDQFKINGFNAQFKLDHNSNGEGIMLFVREDISAKLIASNTPLVEGLCVEVKLRKQMLFL